MIFFTGFESPAQEANKDFKPSEVLIRIDVLD